MHKFPMHSGKTSTFLNDRGFGWMLETSLEDDEDVQLPLLFVFIYSSNLLF